MKHRSAESEMNDCEWKFVDDNKKFTSYGLALENCLFLYSTPLVV